MLPSIDSEMLAKTLQNRRQRLATLIKHPVILWSGRSCSRNFPQNVFPFRASSHFLYFAGLPLENAVIRLSAGRMELFVDESTADDALWHGAIPQPDDLAEWIGADAVFSLASLKANVDGAATIPVQDQTTHLQQSRLLNRLLGPASALEGIDLELAKAIATLRLTHDQAALMELRQAAQVTVKAHFAGVAATSTAKTEADIRAAMEGILIAHNMTGAYASIVTVQGEVLHNNQYYHNLQVGDLLLADVGAETPLGWAADVTRTWPVSGQFSSTQRDIYDIVLAAHDACIAKVQPGVEYLDIHWLAATVISEGLIDLGILHGQTEDLVAMDAHALFFPHGVGHLLGLDVHDMEDLGDLAGYEAGRQRGDRFGLGFLRLDRPLRPGMVVTIEPGFYQIPTILQDPARRSQYQDAVDWDRLAQFSDVRGVRIEDDVLVTAEGSEVLTAALPTDLTSGVMS